MQGIPVQVIPVRGIPVIESKTIDDHPVIQVTQQGTSIRHASVTNAAHIWLLDWGVQLWVVMALDF